MSTGGIEFAPDTRRTGAPVTEEQTGEKSKVLVPGEWSAGKIGTGDFVRHVGIPIPGRSDPLDGYALPL